MAKGLSMRVNRELIDKCCDFVPFVSTINGSIDLVQKNLALKEKISAAIRLDPSRLNDHERYYVHLNEKSNWRCALILIPVFGNIALAGALLSREFFMFVKKIIKSLSETPTIAINRKHQQLLQTKPLVVKYWEEIIVNCKQEFYGRDTAPYAIQLPNHLCQLLPACLDIPKNPYYDQILGIDYKSYTKEHLITFDSPYRYLLEKYNIEEFNNDRTLFVFALSDKKYREKQNEWFGFWGTEGIYYPSGTITQNKAPFCGNFDAYSKACFYVLSKKEAYGLRNGKVPSKLLKIINGEPV